MSHTVMMVFPRQGTGAAGVYRPAAQPDGDIHLTAPDGSTLIVHGRTGGLRPSADFAIAPLGAPGTPPRLFHSGLHLKIRAVGRSPFLRGTPVEVTSAEGTMCSLRTDDLFLYGDGPESDLFGFSRDEDFFGFLDGRCPGLRRHPLLLEAALRPLPVPVPAPAAADPVPILVPVSTRPAVSKPYERPLRRTWSPPGGGLLRQLFSY